MPPDAGIALDAGPRLDSGLQPGMDASAPDAAAPPADSGFPSDASGSAPDTGPEPALPPSSVGAVVPPSGPTVYVDAVNGTPSGTGSAAAPFQTIPAGVAAISSSGGTVVVRSGRYQGPVQIAGTANPILVQAAAGERPVLDCAAPVTGWQVHTGNVWKVTPPTPVAAVFHQGAFLQRARYPLAGYLTTAAGATDKLTLPIDPADAAFLAGKDLSSALATVRIVDYWWNTVVVKSLDTAASKLVVDGAPPAALAGECLPNCSFSYVPSSGWGYFLENEPWMMTQPGSWAFDPAANTLYVWLPGDADPNSAGVEISGPSDCLAISNSPGVTVQGLSVAHAGGTGVTDSSNRSRFNRVDVHHVKKHGFDLTGPFVVDESSVSFTGSQGLTGGWPGGTQPSDSVIESSRFTDIGTALGPRFVGAAIMVLEGTPVRLTIRNNYLARLAYIGTYSAAGTLIEGNTMEDFCLLADDCGGIYVSDRCPGQTIRGNILRRATANLEGKPPSRGAYNVSGIYLDDYSRNMVVEGNVVSETDMALMLHDAHDNVFSNNQFFAFTRGGVWIQEDGNLRQYNPATGSFDPVLDAGGQPLPAMTNNDFQSNFFADVHGAPLVQQSSSLGNTLERLLGAFSGSGNTYWNLYSPRVVSSGAGGFGFGDLLAAGLDSAPRRCGAQIFGAWATDSASADVFAASPGNLSGFSTWSSAGTPTKAVVTCPTPSTSGGCLEFRASDSAQTLLNSPVFPVAGQQFYRIRFQASSLVSPPPFVRLILRRNSSPWDDLDVLQQALVVQPSTGAWTASEFYVQAKESVADARIDLEVPAGADLVVGDLVVTPVAVRPDPPERHFQGLVNVGYAQPETFPCPFSGAACTGWTDVSDATTAFPATVAPRSATPLWHP
ncbi:MAG TPA: right-handed parallel beta-helix repeat-containing protein [Myxococcales bacterium]